jgi:hypothetical protein
MSASACFDCRSCLTVAFRGIVGRPMVRIVAELNSFGPTAVRFSLLTGGCGIVRQSSQEIRIRSRRQEGQDRLREAVQNLRLSVGSDL